jgi:hypothetical protein
MSKRIKKRIGLMANIATVAAILTRVNITDFLDHAGFWLLFLGLLVIAVLYWFDRWRQWTDRQEKAIASISGITDQLNALREAIQNETRGRAGLESERFLKSPVG